jgi:hypothetical protein
MKKIILSLSGLLVLLSALAFTSPQLQEKSLSQLLTYLRLNFDQMWQNTEFDYDSAHTYLEESGVRGRYFVVKKVMGLSVVEQLVGEKAFLNGPHQGVVDFGSTSFGHYNPQFLGKLHDMLEETLDSQGFVQLLQPLYDRDLKRYLQTFYLSYELGTQNEALKQEYLKKVEAGDYGAGWFLMSAFDDFSSTLTEDSYDYYPGRPSWNGEVQYDWAEAASCPGFWLRRSIDGTAEAFHNLLMLMLTRFDKDFVREHEPEALPGRWLVVLKSSSSREEAVEAQAQLLFKNEVLFSSNYPSLSPGSYLNCIAFAREEDAKVAAKKIKKFGLEAELKFAGKNKKTGRD